MQFSRYLTYSKSGSTFKHWALVLKVLFTLASFYYLVSRLLEERLLIGKLVVKLNDLNFAMVLIVVVLLMFINWWFEVMKWRIIAKPYQYLSFVDAFKAVVSGISLDAVLPFGSGAIAAKVLSLNGGKRNMLVPPIIVGQGLQSFWTAVLGMIGLWQLVGIMPLSKVYNTQSIFLVVSGLAIITIIAYLIWPTHLSKWVSSIRLYSYKNWGTLAGLSLLRYMVFLVQLLILSRYFEPTIPFEVLLGCSTWVFLAKTIVPKPGHLGALGIRGAAAIYFLGLFGYPYLGFVLATFILWLVNLAMPSFIGLFFIKNLKFALREHDS